MNCLPSATMRPQDGKGGGYDAATVILDADAGKVYDTALELLRTNGELTLLKKDDKTFGLETMCVGGGQGMAMIVERLS